MRVILVLHNIRSVYNVGAMLRTFEGFSGSEGEVVFSGVTPCDCRPGLLPHLAERISRQIAKTALSAEKLVSCSFSEDILGFLEAKKRSGSVILGLENNLSDRRVVRLSEISGVLEREFGARGGDSGGSFGASGGISGGSEGDFGDFGGSSGGDFGGSEVFKEGSEGGSEASRRDFEVVLVVGEEVDGISAEILGICDVLAEIPMRGRKESFNVSVATGVALYELLGR